MSLEGFSAAQIQHLHASTLDLFVKGPFKEIGIQDKPLLKRLEAKAKPFGAAKENISLPVKFDRGANGVDDSVKGFSGAEKVGFYNPANGKRATYIWREHHIGITLTETELKTQGILVGDEFGNTTKNSGDRSFVVLADILETANKDWMERRADSMNRLLWGDGSADASALHGIRAFISDIPTIGVTGGLSRTTNARWRNRARTQAFAAHASFDATWGGGRITSSPTNGGALITALQHEWRQLVRYGAKPNCFLCGSDFIEAYEGEFRANGFYSMTGFTGSQDGAVGDVKFKGITLEYDPTLDEMGRSKFGYLWDDRQIVLRPLEGDWKRMRTPARPFNQFVLHKSLVDTGQLTSDQLDGALVIEIA